MSNPSRPQPFTHTPFNGQVLDTSPEALGFNQPEPPAQKDASPTPSRVKRMSNVVEKTVEKTVDKLSRSINGMAGRTSPTTPPPSGHRRLFSLSRKGKGRDFLGDSDSKLSSSFIPADNLQCKHRSRTPNLLLSPKWFSFIFVESLWLSHTNSHRPTRLPFRDITTTNPTRKSICTAE